MALDAGTTSNRCILFDQKGQIVSLAQKEFTQRFPKPGWVEHDANEIWSTMLGVAVEAMQKAGASYEDIAAIGITNQRETAIVWDKNTGVPVYHAIVWQCRRTSEYCDSLMERGLVDRFREKTGKLSLFNAAIEKGIQITFSTEDFPQITQWKMMGERDYVLGLEPCTNTLEGRSEIRRRKELTLLPPGESRTFSVQVKLFNSSSQWEASL